MQIVPKHYAVPEVISNPFLQSNLIQPKKKIRTDTGFPMTVRKTSRRAAL